MLDTREGDWAVYRLVIAQRWICSAPRLLRELMAPLGVALARSWRGDESTQLYNEEFCHPPIPTVSNVEGRVLPVNAVEVSAAQKLSRTRQPVIITYLLMSGKLLSDRNSI
ncbi:hypothetical protein RB195_015148 [Necator americanus]|uniref:Uncharacterized protein n=1 Tax=Necator americanus TaxID=51031 RepID=A0ABR1E5W2_NECAM